jgi:hypothetical protein
MYALNIMDEKVVESVTKHHGVAAKLVDFCNVSDIDAAYILWVETLRYPLQIQTFTGPVWWAHKKEVKLSRVSMISCCLTSSRIVTVTAMTYSECGVLK